MATEKVWRPDAFAHIWHLLKDTKSAKSLPDLINGRAPDYRSTTHEIMAKNTAKKATSVATKKTAAKKAAAKKNPVGKAPVKTAVRKTATKKTPRPSLKAGAPTPTITTITAKVDIGFGNSLYLRGGGAGLTWEKGVLMGNAASDEWVWSTDAVDGTLEFKVVINDETWAIGGNCFVSAGDRIVVEPTFD